MGDKLSTIERNVSLQLSDLTTIMPENLSDYYLALASLDLKTTAQISALEQNVSDIKDALTSHVTNSTQSIADVWSDVEGLFKTTESLRESLCVFKTGHSLTSGRCMNVSGVEADYQTAQANCAASGGHLLILKSRDVDAPVLRDVLTAAGKHFSNIARCRGSGDGGGGSGLSAVTWRPGFFGDGEEGVTLLPSYCRQTQEEGATKADSRTVLGCKGDNLTLHKPDIGVTVLFTSVFRGENSLANSFIAASGEFHDPRGDMLPNDGFEDQAFYLDLPLSSAVSGDYCCQLDCRAPDYCCLDPQSPLRQCAPVHVQTDTVEEVKKVDCPSLDSFSRLQQQVLDLVMAQRELQESESQSGVATIAQLVQRQAKCDQLDVYMTRVEDLEDKLKIGLDAAMNKALISDERWRQG
ncbi:hypothetical protein C0Q70_07216 [Pomacea canaliculata]|uniref:C-type lectin domain-containing protein n=1 Tax=Pomacea canaliculata TaxID=400727 RepID=A0A2T7PEF5_POMCA|nr:hypothetical protein C0Q70_07216 [Pomacea canaliculata]